MFLLLRFIVTLTLLYFCSVVSAIPATYNLKTHVITIPTMIVIDEQTNENDATQLNLLPQSKVKAIVKDGGVEVIESTPLFCRFSPSNLGCE